MHDLGDGYTPTNREKNREPKQGVYWCGRCDHNLVGDYEKCGVCGCRNGVKRAPARDARHS